MEIDWLYYVTLVYEDWLCFVVLVYVDSLLSYFNKSKKWNRLMEWMYWQWKKPHVSPKTTFSSMDQSSLKWPRTDITATAWVTLVPGNHSIIVCIVFQANILFSPLRYNRGIQCHLLISGNEYLFFKVMFFHCKEIVPRQILQLWCEVFVRSLHL